MDYSIWHDALQTLRKKTGFDFAGIASVIRDRRTLLVWRLASGNRNKNYLKIVLEPGKGVAGGIYRNKRAMVVQDTLQEYDEDEIVHSPILLAEDLRSFAAFPLWAEGDVEGVLLLAMRKKGMVSKERYDQVVGLLADGICGMEIRPDPYEIVQGGRENDFRALPIYELVDVPVRAALHNERHRIAQDIHDSVIQDLLGVQMQLRTLKYAKNMEEMHQGLREADGHMSRILKELRTILVSVKPGILEDLGLCAALRKHFLFLETSYKMEIAFHENVGSTRFAEEIENVVYRICQEATANACKYSGTDRIEVELLMEDNILFLRILDSGMGFDTENPEIFGEGMGLPGMRFWAADVGASLTVHSEPGRGTGIFLEVPIQ